MPEKTLLGSQAAAVTLANCGLLQHLLQLLQPVREEIKGVRNRFHIILMFNDLGQNAYRIVIIANNTRSLS
jgi:hypothetical protein